MPHPMYTQSVKVTQGVCVYIYKNKYIWIDRKARIEAVQRNPERAEVWAALTKHDANALRHLRDCVSAVEVEYHPTFGWLHPAAAPLLVPAGQASAPASPAPHHTVSCSVHQCAAVWYSVVQCGAVCCGVLQCVLPTLAPGSSAPPDALHCSMLQYRVVWCSVVQRVAMWCRVVHCGAVWCSVARCVAASFSALQCVAVGCSVLQCVAVIH